MLLLRNSQFCFWSATPLPRFSDSYSSMKVINHFFVCPSPWVTLLSDIQCKALEPNSFTKICIMCKLLTNFTPKNQVNFDFDRDHDLMATDSRISEVTVGKCTLGQSMFDSYFNQGPSLIISYPSFRFHCILIFIIINENLLKFRCRETFARWDRLICNFDLTSKILNIFIQRFLF